MAFAVWGREEASQVLMEEECCSVLRGPRPSSIKGAREQMPTGFHLAWSWFSEREAAAHRDLAGVRQRGHCLQAGGRKE